MEIKREWLNYSSDLLVEAFYEATFWQYHDEDLNGEIVTIAEPPPRAAILAEARKAGWTPPRRLVHPHGLGEIQVANKATQRP